MDEAAKKVETPSLIDVDVTKPVTQETKAEISDVKIVATTEGRFSILSSFHFRFQMLRRAALHQ